jgi:hypothetical protein
VDLLAPAFINSEMIERVEHEDPGRKVQDAIRKLPQDEAAAAKAAAFARISAQWDGPKLAAERLADRYAAVR